jgi:phage-related protein
VLNEVMDKYKVFSYEDSSGKDLIIESVQKFTKSQKSKYIRQTQYLRMFGITQSNPVLKKVVGTRMWEMRSLGKDNLRIFCAKYRGGVVLLHVFIKKTQKTSSGDLLIAQRRLSELLD